MSNADGFQVPTTPVAPGRDRRPWLVIATLAGVLLGAIALAHLTSGPDVVEVLPTVGPTVPLVAVEPVATALPQLEWFSGTETPLRDVLVEGRSLRWLRLVSGRLLDGSVADPGQDLLMRAARGGTLCLCWQVGRFEDDAPRGLALVRMDRDQHELSRTMIVPADQFDLDGISGPPPAALQPSPDGRLAYLALAARTATRWQVSLEVIDLAREAVVGSVELFAGPQANLSKTLEVQLPVLRIAPDGRHALVMAAVRQETALGTSLSTPHAWIVDVDGASLGSVTASDDIANPSADTCPWVDLVTPDIVAQGCQLSGPDQPSSFEINRRGLDGRDLGTILVPSRQNGGDDALLDVTRGIAYIWDPVANHLTAADLVTGDVQSSETPDDLADPADVTILGDRPRPATATTWSDGRSGTDRRPDRTLVGSPDGQLLFAIGHGDERDSSSGVWVFAARNLELLERWPAKAAYQSLALLDDGRFLAAIGSPGVDESGRRAQWGTSMTVHDAVTGRPVMRIGDLAPGEHMTVMWPLPVVAPPHRGQP
ncbi:MAG TPA: hypothetical protein VMT36_05245 [Candidatus Saccharimonadia bacterium]|nr:hypothetical protein [Candidatus Saccharimonadia bacterium]